MIIIQKAPKGETKGYTNVPNEISMEKTLSLQAKAMLMELLSFPPDWRISETSFTACNDNGLTFVKSTLRELERKGYLERKRKQGKKGQFGEMDYIVTLWKSAENEKRSTMIGETNTRERDEVRRANTTENEPVFDSKKDSFFSSANVRENDDGYHDVSEETDGEPAPLYNNYDTVLNNTVLSNTLNRNKDRGLSSFDDVFSDGDVDPAVEQERKRLFAELCDNFDFSWLSKRYGSTLTDELKKVIERIIRYQGDTLIVNGERVPTEELLSDMRVMMCEDDLENVLSEVHNASNDGCNVTRELFDALIMSSEDWNPF